MALCVPGFTVNNVAFERKMKVDEVASQLRDYVDQKRVERADEVLQGTARKMRFEKSIERVPETFFDLSVYQSRLRGQGDCAVISVAIAEGKTYSVAAAALSDSTQEDGGIRTIDLKSYLDGKGYAHAPHKKGVSLEDLWHSDFIAVGDAGVILAAGDAGVANHAVGFREGKMYVSDPILTSQLYASAPVMGVFFRKTTETAAIARVIQSQTTQTPVSIHERIMTQVELEALKGALVNEIMSSLAAHWNVVPIHEGV